MRKTPLTLLFAGALLGAAIMVAPIYVPILSNAFADPESVPPTADDYVSQRVENKLKFINVLPVPTWHGLAYLFIDLRTGEKKRIAIGDTVLVKFSDGKYMKVTLVEPYPTLFEYRFIAIPSTLSDPNAPAGGGVRIIPETRIGDGSTSIPAGYQFVGSPDDYESCLMGFVAYCRYERTG